MPKRNMFFLKYRSALCRYKLATVLFYGFLTAFRNDGRGDDVDLPLTTYHLPLATCNLSLFSTRLSKCSMDSLSLHDKLGS